MSYFNIDFLIVGIFLLLTLWVGLRAGRGIKDIREYAVANKAFGTGALTLTLLATFIGGGSLLKNPEEAFTNGIMIAVALSGVLVGYLIWAFCFTPKMARFKECLTLGDVVGTLYGPKAR